MTRWFVSSYWCVIVYICVFDSSSSDDDDDGRRRTCARARLCIRDTFTILVRTIIQQKTRFGVSSVKRVNNLWINLAHGI